MSPLGSIIKLHELTKQSRSKFARPIIRAVRRYRAILLYCHRTVNFGDAVRVCDDFYIFFLGQITSCNNISLAGSKAEMSLEDSKVLGSYVEL